MFSHRDSPEEGSTKPGNSKTMMKHTIIPTFCCCSFRHHSSNSICFSRLRPWSANKIITPTLIHNPYILDFPRELWPFPQRSPNPETASCFEIPGTQINDVPRLSNHDYTCLQGSG
jgi:hypothetical protein